MQRGFLAPRGRGGGGSAPAAPAGVPLRHTMHFPAGAAYAVYQSCGRGAGCACRGCTLAGQQVEPPLPALLPGAPIREVVVDLGYAEGELSDNYSDSDGGSAHVATESAHADQRGRERPRSASPDSEDMQFTHQRRLNDTPSERSEGEHATAGATPQPVWECCTGCECRAQFCLSKQSENMHRIAGSVEQFRGQQVAWNNMVHEHELHLGAMEQRLHALEQQNAELQRKNAELQRLVQQQPMQPPCMAPAQPQQQPPPVQVQRPQRPQQQRQRPEPAPPPPAAQQQRAQPAPPPPPPPAQQQPAAPQQQPAVPQQQPAAPQQQAQRPQLAPHLQQQQEQWPALSSASAQRQQPQPQQPRSTPAPATARTPATAATAAPNSGPGPNAAPRQRRNAGQLPASFLESLPYRKQFILQGRAALFPGSGPALSEQLHSFLCSRFQLDTDAVIIADAARVNANSVFFSVDALQQATTLVSKRRVLRDSGTTLYEVLSPQERVQHARLMPQFIAARKAGKRVQFNRAQLSVDRVAVSPSP